MLQEFSKGESQDLSPLRSSKMRCFETEELFLMEYSYAYQYRWTHPLSGTRLEDLQQVLIDIMTASGPLLIIG
jgi:hypothetical protein